MQTRLANIKKTNFSRASVFGCLFVTVIAANALQAAEIESSIARGVRLYDKWYKVIDAEAPTKFHPLYPSDKAYAEKPGANWRCMECHGWDYMGRDVAYASGKHASGIAGTNGAAGMPADKIISTLQASEHGFADLLSDPGFTDLANFCRLGSLVEGGSLFDAD